MAWLDFVKLTNDLARWEVASKGRMDEKELLRISRKHGVKVEDDFAEAYKSFTSPWGKQRFRDRVQYYQGLLVKYGGTWDPPIDQMHMEISGHFLRLSKGRGGQKSLFTWMR